MNVYKVEVNRMLRSLLVWTAIMSGIIILFLSLFPSMANSTMSELVQTKIDAVPESMRAALGISMTTNFSDLLQYYAYSSQYILLGSCAYAILLGTNALISEESNGTIEFLYAQPLSRTDIVTRKLASHFTILLLFNMLLGGITWIVCEIVKPEGYTYILTLLTIVTCTFVVQVVFLSIGFAISTIVPRSSMATPIGLGVLFTTYLLGTFAAVVEKIDWIRYVSPLHYGMPSELLKNDGMMTATDTTLSIIIIVACIVFTYIRYQRKDFRV